MSIIEKAVNTLDKQTSSEESSDLLNDLTAKLDTVQRATDGIYANETAQSTGTSGPGSVAPEHSSTDRENATALSSSGAAATINLPFDEMHSRGMLTPAHPRSAIAEQYRTIKRPLLTNIAGLSAAPISNSNLIMVTSALQGDGKTFSSINLAMSIAMEQDKTVLFVYADTAKAEAGRLLGWPVS